MTGKANHGSTSCSVCSQIIFFYACQGLPLSTYFSSTKIKWLFDNVPEIRQAFKEGDLMIGTVDTWLLWNLTGGVKDGLYITDATNASRTQLMNLETLQWDPYLLSFFDLPLVEANLPQIRSSCEIYGKLSLTQIKVQF